MQKVRKQFILDPLKIKKAKKILHLTTDTEVIDEALNRIIRQSEAVTVLQKYAGKMKLVNMDQSFSK